MTPDLLLTRLEALPESYRVEGSAAGWRLAVSGTARSAAGPAGTVTVVGDPLLRGAPGADCCAEFLAAAERGREVDFLRERMLGNYALAHRTPERIRIYCAPAGLHHVFHGADAASTSLRGLVAATRPAFDPVSVYQFIGAGYTFGRRTVFDGVKRLLGGERIEADAAGLRVDRWHSLATDPGRIDPGALGDFVQRFFEECRPSLAALGPLRVDVTGGFDTRLLVAVLHHLRVPFEGWVSGAAQHPDVTIAKEIGRRLGFPVRHVDVAGQSDAAMAFGIEHDGRQQLLKTFPAWLDMMFANAQVQQDRRLTLSGHGGEQFRDFPWLQEFPFYGLRRVPNVDLQIRLRLLATPVDPGLMHPGIAAGVREENHRRMVDEMRAIVDEIRPADNLSACLALYMVFKEGGRVGSSASEKTRFFANWAPFLEPALWLESGRTPWLPRLGAGLTLPLAERFAPALRGLPTAAMGQSARGPAAALQIMGHYGRRATAKLMQKLHNRPYASGQPKSQSAFELLIRRPEFRDRVLGAVEPCGLNRTRVEAMLDHPEVPAHTEVLGALVNLGRLAADGGRVAGPAPGATRAAEDLSVPGGRR